MRRISSLLLALGVLAATACEPRQDTDAPATAPPPAAEQPASPQQTDAAQLSDPDVAHAAVTANRIDVEMAELALDRSEHAEVRAFAERMVADHELVIERATQLAQRLGVTPSENAVSRSLQQDAEATRNRLAGLAGAEFDRAYIQHEVQFHQSVLQALDETLIPSADNAELRSLLGEARTVIESHLEHARRVQGTLGTD